MVRKIEIVSLSRGILGETFVRHELELGLKRLEEMGVEVVFSPNALMGLDYISAHPEARADDLISAFQDDSVDMILCAIGGDDTYRLLPYLFSYAVAVNLYALTPLTVSSTRAAPVVPIGKLTTHA